jgi:hypothetical protein
MSDLGRVKSSLTLSAAVRSLRLGFRFLSANSDHIMLSAASAPDRRNQAPEKMLASKWIMTAMECHTDIVPNASPGTAAHGPE